MNARGDRLRARLSIDPDAVPPPPAPKAEPPAEPVPSPSTPPPTPPAARKPPTNRPRPASTTARPSALEDPGITPGKRDYRSFYVEDSVFARFRAAVYWTARHPDAAGEVPENMSAAVEEWMRETAGDLEQRFNRGEVFRMPTAAKRRKPGK